MTTSELTAKIGQTATWRIGELRVFVIVKDARMDFGKLRLLVAPVAGEGQTWKDEDSLSEFQDRQT